MSQVRSFKSAFPRVLVSKNGFAQHILSSLSHVYPALEDRLEMFEHYHVETDEDLRTWEALFANVNRGSHLFIDVGDNLMTAACRVGIFLQKKPVFSNLTVLGNEDLCVGRKSLRY